MQRGRGQRQRDDLKHGRRDVEPEQRLLDATVLGDGESEEGGVEVGVGGGIGGDASLDEPQDCCSRPTPPLRLSPARYRCHSRSPLKTTEK